MPSATCDGLQFALYLPILLAALFLIGRTDCFEMPCLFYSKKNTLPIHDKKQQKIHFLCFEWRGPNKRCFCIQNVFVFPGCFIGWHNKKKNKKNLSLHLFPRKNNVIDKEWS